jgi:polysaccharide deacetylase 2 family uncharacterized protein YibQ
VPLEPINYPQVNPGPGTLLVTMKPDHIETTLRRYIAQAGAVSAVANHMGSLATQDKTVMGAVYDELKREHPPFLHVNGRGCRVQAARLANGRALRRADAVIEVARNEYQGARQTLEGTLKAGARTGA